jgi:PAS domain S-box-containing protein
MNQDPYKVLLIEDNPEQARLMKLITGRSEFAIESSIAHDAESGLHLLQEQSFDVVVLDYHLPRLNGLQALKKIKDLKISIPVIMVTGQGDERIAVQAMRQGAYDYLVKSKDYLDLLPSVIERAMKEKRLSSQLQQSEQRFFALFDRASIAIFIIDAVSLHMIQVNKRAEELIGLESTQLMQRPFQDLCSQRSLKEWHKFYSDLREKGHANSDQIFLVRSDNRLFPVDVNASLVSIGPKKVVQLFVRDISEKFKMQKQLLLSRQRLISLFDGITDLISVQDREHNLIMGNKRYAQAVTQHAQKLVGEKCYKALFNRSTPCDNCPARETFATGEARFLEIFYHGRTFHIWTYPMAGLDGKPEFLIEYVKDVTDQKEIEKQLIKAEKLASIGLLSSGIAHELRNPLNIIETARYTIEEILENKDATVENRLSIIKKNVRRASIIIDNLLQFSRHSDYERERIDLRKLLDQTLDLLEKDVNRRNIEIVKEIQDTPKTFFSLDSLKQVFLNIILNAVQAMPEGGKLLIRTRTLPDDQWVTIDFIDSGKGISEENLKHIFTPFFSTKRNQGGTGLGLYLSYTIIKREGGDISVKSKEDKGTQFSIKLPVAKATDTFLQSISVNSQHSNYVNK